MPMPPRTRASHPRGSAPLSPSVSWQRAEGNAEAEAEAEAESVAVQTWSPVSPSIGWEAKVKELPIACSNGNTGRAEDVKQATFPRASRAARASDPAQDLRSVVALAVRKCETNLLSRGYRKAPRVAQAFRTHKIVGAGTSVSKGASAKMAVRDQHRINHLASIKAKGIDANNTEPAFLLGGYTAPMTWERLAASAFKANAVSSSQMGRKKTESATPQYVYALGTTPPQPQPTVHYSHGTCLWQNDAHQLHARGPGGRGASRGRGHQHGRSASPLAQPRRAGRKLDGNQCGQRVRARLGRQPRRGTRPALWHQLDRAPGVQQLPGQSDGGVGALGVPHVGAQRAWLSHDQQRHGQPQRDAARHLSFACGRAHVRARVVRLRARRLPDEPSTRTRPAAHLRSDRRGRPGGNRGSAVRIRRGQPAQRRTETAQACSWRRRRL